MSTGLYLVPRPTGQAAADTASHFRNLSVDRLVAAIRQLVEQTENSVRHTTQLLRDRLLPALEILKRKCAGQRGAYGKTLRAAGLNPATVRKWRQREREAAKRIAELLGGQPMQRPKPGKRRQVDLDESDMELLARAGLDQDVGRKLHPNSTTAAFLEWEMSCAKKIQNVAFLLCT